MLTATFTVSPIAFPSDQSSDEQSSAIVVNGADRYQANESETVVDILANTLPNILQLLSDTDRALPVFSTISTQVLGPTFRSRRFPQNVTFSTTEILKVMSKIPDASKLFKKDVADAFKLLVQHGQQFAIRSGGAYDHP